MLILILIISFVLRIIDLNQSLWLDEAVQAITAQNSLGYLFQEITGDFHPPLYHILMHFWVEVFGNSEISLRMPSVLFGTGTVWLIYRLGLLGKLGRFGAILAALFIATSQFHVYYSQEARMYAMAAFFTALSMYYFIKISNFKDQNLTPNRKARNWNYFWYLLSSLCLIYTDYYGLLILLAQGIYLIIKKEYKFLLIACCILLIAYIPWLPMMVKQIKVGMLATQILPQWSRLVNVSFFKAIPLTLVKFTIGRVTIFNKTVYGLVILAILGLLAGLGYWGWLKGKKRGMEERENTTLILLWFFVPLIVSWLASIWVPNFQPFRLLLILPAFYLLVTEGIERLDSKRSRIIFTGLFLLINVVSLSVYYLNPYFKREDWKSTVKFLQQQKNSAVLLPSSASNWPVKYYDSEEKINLISGITGVGEIKTNPEIAGDVVYYLRYLVPVFDPNELILASLKKEGYTKIREISFNQITVWEYRKNF